MWIITKTNIGLSVVSMTMYMLLFKLLYYYIIFRISLYYNVCLVEINFLSPYITDVKMYWLRVMTEYSKNNMSADSKTNSQGKIIWPWIMLMKH